MEYNTVMRKDALYPREIYDEEMTSIVFCDCETDEEAEEYIKAINDVCRGECYFTLARY